MSVTTTPTSFSALSQHLHQWFHRPDMQAVEIVLAAAASHRLCESDPIWLMVMGPSGSGKTSILINLVKSLPEAYVLGDLTEKTFISHYGGKQCGLLTEVKNGIFLFKDFTSIISKRDDQKNEIFAQLREIYDGCWRRNTGVVEGSVLWEGKVSVIAVGTEAVERAWSLRRELGERFINLRWDRVGGYAFARQAAQQRGRDKLITARTSELGRNIINQAKGASQWVADEELAALCAHFAEFVAILRGSVVRDSHGGREIIDFPSIEEPTRLDKAFELLCSAHAALHDKLPTMTQAPILRRVAWDSIPVKRAYFIRCLLEGSTVSQNEISKFTGIPQSTVRWIADELAALKAITISQDAIGGTDYTMTPIFQELCTPIRPL